MQLPAVTLTMACRKSYLSLRAFSAARSRTSLLDCAWKVPSHVSRRWSSNSSPEQISTIAPPEKPFYVTTPIFYVNAAPHIGHLYTLVLADVIKRWQELHGKNSILLTGTDEHGMKVQQAAYEAQQDPEDFCTAAAEKFKNLAHEANLSKHHFIRTTDPIHHDAVQYAWHLLCEAGYIYHGKHEGWYSISDETFYPNSAVQVRVDPKTGHKRAESCETGKPVEYTSETNYHFKLSAFQDRLIQFYQSENPKFVVPEARHNDILQQLVSKPLADLSISRPRERLTWGIQVPHDPDQTIYVWMDALLNYLTASGYPFIPGLESAHGWPADVHVIGKDIVRFHCIYWPAFLMALNLPLPKTIVTHAHWTMNKQKMSKSTGNVVNPGLALSRFGVDTMRYYLIHDGNLEDDADYSNEMVTSRYARHLQARLGNILGRVSGKAFELDEAVLAGAGRPWAQIADGSSKTVPGNAALGQMDWQILENDKLQLSALFEIPKKVEELMGRYDVHRALRELAKIMIQTTKYISATEPWSIVTAIKLVEGGGNLQEVDRLKNELRKVIFLCIEGLRVPGIMLQPFMPEKAAELLDRLGVRRDRRDITWALGMGKDAEYCQNFDRSKKVLFPPLPSYE